MDQLTLDAVGGTQVRRYENGVWEAIGEDPAFMEQKGSIAISRGETEVVQNHDRGLSSLAAVPNEVEDQELLAEVKRCDRLIGQ